MNEHTLMLETPGMPFELHKVFRNPLMLQATDDFKHGKVIHEFKKKWTHEHYGVVLVASF